MCDAAIGNRVDTVEGSKSPSRCSPFGLLEWIEQSKEIGLLRRYRKRDTLFSQGDAVGSIYVLKLGHVKSFSIAPNGRSHIFAIQGSGHALGLCDYLVSGVHELTAEAIEDTEAYVISLRDFDRLLASSVSFLRLLLRAALAGERGFRCKIRALASFNVEQRLKQGLLTMAEEHGRVTNKGIKIGVNLTHQDLAEFVAADRATITVRLNALRKQGDVSVDERRLVLAHPERISASLAV